MCIETCMRISLLFHIHTHLSPYAYVWFVLCSVLITIFLFYFLSFYKFNRHLCHGAYWCTHNPAHMSILFFHLYLPISNIWTNKYINTIICKKNNNKINYCSSDTPIPWWMLKEIKNPMHMIHDKMDEKHKFINKLKITSIYNEICK